MKTKFYVLTTSLFVLMTSCTSYFYQVYKAEPSNDIVLKNGSLVYEDENCHVSYNFWGDNGNIGFSFYNKTDKDIYLNLGESYFVVNGVANDYFKNRVFTKTGGSSVLIASYYLGIGATSSSNLSVAQKEEELVRIPSMASKNISEYLITEDIYRNCDLLKEPKKNQIRTITFKKENSPLVFSNRLTYMIEKAETPIKFNNEFYVTEITNYPEDELIEWKSDEFCGQKSSTRTKHFRDISPAKFYIKYSSTYTGDYFKH